ncbi:MAG: hypothetical protein ACK58N_04235 [Synechocystis sp.]
MKQSSQPLRPSPYLTRRDPVTGQWLIIKPNAASTNPNEPSSDQGEAAPEPDCCQYFQ